MHGELRKLRERILQMINPCRDFVSGCGVWRRGALCIPVLGGCQGFLLSLGTAGPGEAPAERGGGQGWDREPGHGGKKGHLPAGTPSVPFHDLGENGDRAEAEEVWGDRDRSQ